MPKKKKRIKPAKRKQIKHMGMGIFIGYTLCLTICFALLFIPNIATITLNSTLKTGGADMDYHLMGLSIKDPYSISGDDVVILSDNYGNGYVDATMTEWTRDETKQVYDYFESEDNEDIYVSRTFEDYVLNNYVTSSSYSWVDGAHTNLNAWSKKSWSSSSVAWVDPDGPNSGIPDLGISLANIYPSNSNGIPDDEYGHTKRTLTLVDDLGNKRTVDLHVGFVTLEIVFIVQSGYIGETGWNDNALRGGMTETSGQFQVANIWYETCGAPVDFNAVFGFAINSLDFGDKWQLNPDYVDFGNGIMDIYRRNFGEAEVDGESINGIQTQDMQTWEFKGSNDIELRQVEHIDRFSNVGEALDKTKKLNIGDESSLTNFKDNTPDFLYFPIENFVELGLYSRIGNGGFTQIDSILPQKIAWVQRVTIQFYTSVGSPLAGSGYDPIKIYVDIDNPLPKERLWDRLLNWVMELFGVNRAVAQLIIIVCIIIVSIIVVLILLAIFAPQVLGFLGKAIAGAFKRSAERRAARRATRK